MYKPIMLNEERKRIIVELTNDRNSISVVQLMELLDASESTIRRDLTELDAKGLLKKVHGGAVSLHNQILTQDASVEERQVQNIEEKRKIAEYAASLIKDNDVVYLDAGTTTFMMIEFLHNSKATFITDSISHASALAAQNHTVNIPGGMLKTVTGAVIGAETCQYLSRTHFTIGFFGANGITKKDGATTPDPQEAAVKNIAYTNTREKFILADSSKFDQVCTTTFAPFDQGIILTTSNAPKEYQKVSNIALVDLVE